MRSSMSLSSAMTQLLSGAKLRMPPRSSSPEQSVIKFKSSPYRPRSEGPEKLLNLRYRPNPSGDVILIFSPHRLSLHFWEMQGEFDEMQGGGKRSPAKNSQISKAWMGFSLLQEQGDYPCLAGSESL